MANEGSSPDQRTNERTNKRTNERTDKRPRKPARRAVVTEQMFHLTHLIEDATDGVGKRPPRSLAAARDLVKRRKIIELVRGLIAESGDAPPAVADICSLRGGSTDSHERRAHLRRRVATRIPPTCNPLVPCGRMRVYGCARHERDTCYGARFRALPMRRERTVRAG